MPSERAMERARKIMSGLPLYAWIADDVDADVVESVTMTIAAALDAARAEEREAWVALLKGGQWQRRDGRTYLAVRVADGADLSCPATREDAILAAIRARQPKPGSSDPAVLFPDDNQQATQEGPTP